LTLPRGWSLVRVADLGTWRGGGTPSKARRDFWTGTIPWVSPKDMKVERLRDTEDHITQEAVEKSSTVVVDSGTVLLVVRSGILKHTFPVAVTEGPAAINQDLKAVSVRTDILPEYVAWAFRAFSGEILHTCSKAGTTVQSIVFSRFKEFQIPVAPNPEQRRMVEAIEEQFSRLDAAEEALRKAHQRALRMKAAVLTSRTAGWPERRIGEFAEVYVGATPSRRRPELWGGPIPWVSSGEVAFSRIRSTRETISQEAVRPERIHAPGTVMLAMIGEGKTRGQAAILDVPATHNQNCAALRLDSSVALPEWVFYVLMGRYEETRRAGSGGNQPALNSDRVRAICLPLPPLQEQARLVAEIDLSLTIVDKTVDSLPMALRRAEELRRAVLREAFAGRLVPQDSSDEPVSYLIEKVNP